MDFRIDTETLINASAKTVWKLLTDLEAYSTWNPFIIKASGEIAMNAKLVCEPKLPNSKKSLKFTPIVTRCIPEKEFAWMGEVIHPLISAGEHVFQIESLSAKKVKLLHFEIFSGITAPLVLLIAGADTKEGFMLMNKALKDLAESTV